MLWSGGGGASSQVATDSTTATATDGTTATTTGGTTGTTTGSTTGTTGTTTGGSQIPCGTNDNCYKIDGNPTGLTSNLAPSGPGTWNNGVYTIHGTTWAKGPATFKFKWHRSATQPEPPPLTAVVYIDSSAHTTDVAHQTTANNGWESKSQVEGMGAKEYKIKANPGESFEMTINPSGSASMYGSIDVAVTMRAIPVVASVSGVTWIVGSGTPPPPAAPHILVGQRAQSSLSVEGLSFVPNGATTNYSWVIPGTKFKKWYPEFINSSGVWQPKLTGFPATDLTLESPYWYWKATVDTAISVLGSGLLNMPTNVYELKQVTVSDEFNLTLRVPLFNIQNLAFDYPSPQGGQYYLQDGSLAYKVFTAVRARQGSVSIPAGFSAGGQYAFVQRIESSTRNGVLKASGTLDGTFPYPYTTQLYGAGVTANFVDGPWQSNTVLPVSADDSFTVTVIFMPGSDLAEWVPLRVGTWKWHGEIQSGATLPAAGTYMNLPNPPNVQSSTAWAKTTTHPDWTGVYDLH